MKTRTKQRSDIEFPPKKETALIDIYRHLIKVHVDQHWMWARLDSGLSASAVAVAIWRTGHVSGALGPTANPWNEEYFHQLLHQNCWITASKLYTSGISMS